ncbi:heterokaryon incompatibility protein (HET) domain-containing protein [Sarocladium implicatum]|nr:heterokaryon incompatibility protein (HET) domain-containing protein [Sarocladium implicatum]
MKFTKLFSRRRAPVYAESNPLTARRESSPDVHQLKSTRRRNGAAGRRPLRRDGALMDMALATSTPSSRVVADEDHPPCVICRAVDFPSLLDWRPGNPRPWVELSHTITQSWVGVQPSKSALDADSLTTDSNSAEETPCPYCTFFRLMIGQLPDESGKFTPYLRVKQAFEKLGVKEKADLGKAVLAEVTTKDKELPWGFILKAAPQDSDSSETGTASVQTYLGQEKLLEGRVVPRMLDPLVPKTWIEFCQANHDDTCGINTAEVVPGLRLVDCQTRSIVSASELEEDSKDRYASLSYVWTGAEKDLQVVVRGDGKLAETLPDLFADAIRITESLGLRYVWIDRLCLPAESASRSEQLPYMGDIFQQAAVTLIPATDEAAGIPGISVPREEQLSLQTDAGLFTTSLIQPDQEVAGCRWATQARTFQEGILSRRRLVFTPSQCYFQCCTLHCHESIGVSLHLAPSLNFGRVFPQHGGGSVPAHFKDLIKAYVPRESASDEERLSGFEGVLKRYRQMDKSVDAVLGIPLFHEDDFSNDAIVSQTDRLAVGLGWMPNGETPAPGSVEPYLYAGDVDGNALPSWTWLSWRVRPGRESLNQAFCFSMVGEASPIVTPGVSAAPKMEISVGFADGILRSWEIDGDIAVKQMRGTSRGRIAYLRMTTWCFDMAVWEDEEQQESDQEESKATLEANLPKSARDRVLEWYREAVQEEKPAVSTPIADALSSKPLPDPENNGIVSEEERTRSAEEAEQSKDEHHLIGLLLSGRGWQEVQAPAPATNAAAPSAAASRSASLNSTNTNNYTTVAAHSTRNAAFTILVCLASVPSSDPHTKLRRLGALLVPCDGFAIVSELAAILRGVETDVGEKKALKLDLREVDLW